MLLRRCSLLLAAALLAAPAQASEVLRVATYNVLALNAGTPAYDALVQMVRRVQPDVLCVQELTLQTGDLSNVSTFASDIGLPNHVVAGAGGTSNDLRVATFSRYPICDSESWTPEEISGDPTANDLTRDILEVRLTVPDVCGPTPAECCGNVVVFNTHLKAGSFNAIDRFRRAVELQFRLVPVMEQAFVDCPGAVVIAAGDLNEADLITGPPEFYASQPPGAPFSYDLGNDVTLPFTYDPDALLTDVGGPNSFLVADAVREDSPGQFGTFLGSGNRLDYIWASVGPGSPSLAAPPAETQAISATEVYDSNVDNGVDDGFFGDLARKYGAGPLPFGVSAQASDHWPVFADLVLDGCDAERIGTGSLGEFELRPVASYSGNPTSGQLAFVRVEQAPPGQTAFLFAGLPLAPQFGTVPIDANAIAPGLIPDGLVSSSGVQTAMPFLSGQVASNGELSLLSFFPDLGG
ncbi:MAG: endonuclease/exonuclease/phosphatase family protein, partial [Planctomycetota bacterium]